MAPPAVRTPNQIVAYNLARARRSRKLTQEQAAAELEALLGVRWSKSSFSFAEQSAHSDTRIREFTADEIVAFAKVFKKTIAFFFLPPPRERDQVISTGGEQTLGLSEFLDLLLNVGEAEQDASEHADFYAANAIFEIKSRVVGAYTLKEMASEARGSLEKVLDTVRALEESADRTITEYPDRMAALRLRESSEAAPSINSPESVE